MSCYVWHHLISSLGRRQLLYLTVCWTPESQTSDSTENVSGWYLINLIIQASTHFTLWYFPGRLQEKFQKLSRLQFRSETSCNKHGVKPNVVLKLEFCFIVKGSCSKGVFDTFKSISQWQWKRCTGKAEVSHSGDGWGGAAWLCLCTEPLLFQIMENVKRQKASEWLLSPSASCRAV